VLPKANRLRSRQDFKKVYQSGRTRSGVYLTVRCLKLGGKGRERERERGSEGVRERGSEGARERIPNSTLNTQHSTLSQVPTRIGISIGLKVSKKAVVRNRIKRQIRAALRQILPQLAPGWLVVITVRSTATECNYVDFLRELEQLLAEAEVLHGHS
jgi:ribonuclease P protein component